MILRETDWDLGIFINPAAQNFNGLFETVIKFIIFNLVNFRDKSEAEFKKPTNIHMHQFLDTLRQYGITTTSRKDVIDIPSIQQKDSEYAIRIYARTNPRFFFSRLDVEFVVADKKNTVEILDFVIPTTAQPDLVPRWYRLITPGSITLVDGIPYFSLSYQYYEILRMFNEIEVAYDQYSEQSNDRFSVGKLSTNIESIKK